MGCLGCLGLPHYSRWLNITLATGPAGELTPAGQHRFHRLQKLFALKILTNSAEPNNLGPGYPDGTRMVP